MGPRACQQQVLAIKLLLKRIDTEYNDSDVKLTFVGESMFRNYVLCICMLLIGMISCKQQNTGDNTQSAQLKILKMYDRITEFDIPEYYNTNIISGNEDYLYISGNLKRNANNNAYEEPVIYAFADTKQFVDSNYQATIIPHLFGEVFNEFSNTSNAFTPFGNFVSPFNENFTLLFAQNRNVVRMRTDFQNYILLFNNLHQNNLNIETNWNGMKSTHKTELTNYNTIKLLITQNMPLMWDGSSEILCYIENNKISSINLTDELTKSKYLMLQNSLICSSRNFVYVIARKETSNTISLLEIAPGKVNIQDKLSIEDEYIHNDTSIMEYYGGYVICVSPDSKKILTIPVADSK